MRFRSSRRSFPPGLSRSVPRPKSCPRVAARAALFGLLAGAVVETVLASGGPGDRRDVRAFGAAGDGTTDDTAAIQNAARRLRPGGTLYFPKGVYLVAAPRGVVLNGVSRVTIAGEGDESVIRRSPAAGESSRLFTFEDCDGVTVRDLTFDVNGVERYGGVVFQHCDRVNVEGTRAFDSNLDPSWARFDHYFLLVQNGRHIEIRDNVASDVELAEVNQCEHVRIENNVSLRAAGTGAIVHATENDGGYAIAYRIAGNVIVDPRRHAISFQHESSGLNRNTWRDITIADNTIHRRNATTGVAVRFGNFTGMASHGNAYERISVRANRIYRAPARRTVEVPEIFFQQKPGNRFERLDVVQNHVETASHHTYAVDLRRLADSARVERNTIINVGNGINLGGSPGVRVSGNRIEVGGTPIRRRDSHPTPPARP